MCIYKKYGAYIQKIRSVHTKNTECKYQNTDCKYNNMVSKYNNAECKYNNRDCKYIKADCKYKNNAEKYEFKIQNKLTDWMPVKFKGVDTNRSINKSIIIRTNQR